MARFTRRLTLVVLVLGLAGPDHPALAFDRIGPRPVVIGEVAYLPSTETRREGERAVFVRAMIRAVDVQTDRELWTIPVREGTSPDGDVLGETKESAIKVMTRFSGGILVRTGDGHFFVDPVARTSRPVMDRRGAANECEVHHRALEDGLIPIRYGLGVREAGRPEDRARLFPNAMTIVNAGCIVRQAKLAAVHYCPACREAAVESARRQADDSK